MPFIANFSIGMPISAINLYISLAQFKHATVLAGLFSASHLAKA